MKQKYWENSEKTEQEKLAIIEKKWQSFLREKVNKGDSDKVLFYSQNYKFTKKYEL